MPETVAQLFDSAFLARLEQLHLLARQRVRGQFRAFRRSRQIGSSLEFADYRTYTPGDDLRSVDWKLYGRLERLFVRLFEEEKDLDVFILVDASRSMAWRPPGDRPTKFDQARRVAACLAYIALANLDRIHLFSFSQNTEADLGTLRGRGQLHRVLRFLEQLPVSPDPTRLAEAVRRFSNRVRRRGPLFLLSDLLDPAGFETAFTTLHHQRFDLRVIHLLDPAELDPDLAGDLRLSEEESDAKLDLTADRATLARYRAGVRAWAASAEQWCARRGLGYALATSETPFESIILRSLRDGLFIR